MCSGYNGSDCGCVVSYLNASRFYDLDRGRHGGNRPNDSKMIANGSVSGRLRALCRQLVIALVAVMSPGAREGGGDKLQVARKNASEQESADGPVRCAP